MNLAQAIDVEAVYAGFPASSKRPKFEIVISDKEAEAAANRLLVRGRILAALGSGDKTLGELEQLVSASRQAIGNAISFLWRNQKVKRVRCKEGIAYKLGRR